MEGEGSCPSTQTEGLQTVQRMGRGSGLVLTGIPLWTKILLNDAIAVFTCNTPLFPSSAYVFDSLGQGPHP